MGKSAAGSLWYVATGYITSLANLVLLYWLLPAQDFAVYAQLQGLLNVIVIASALGVPTASAHLGLMSSEAAPNGASRGFCFSTVLEHTGVQATIAAGIALACVLAVVGLGLQPPSWPYATAFFLLASAGLYPLWGIGLFDLYRPFALILALLKLAQVALILLAQADGRLQAWALSQAAIYAGLLGAFFLQLRLKGLAYRPTQIAWLQVLRASCRSDFPLDALKALWANWLQIAGGLAPADAGLNRVLFADRIAKAAVSFADNILRLDWYRSASAARAWHRALKLFSLERLAFAVACAALLVLLLVQPVPLAGLAIVVIAAAGLLALRNGVHEWGSVRGSVEAVRGRVLSIALALGVAAAVAWAGGQILPFYLALPLALLAGELLIAVRTLGGRSRSYAH